MKRSVLLVSVGIGAASWFLVAPAGANPEADQVSPLEGNWKGVIEVPPVELRVYFHLGRIAGQPLSGYMVSPDQSEARIELSRVALSGSAVEIEVTRIGGRFEGVLDSGAGKILGTWTQRGASFPLELAATESGWALPRPQTPKPPVPSRVEEVKIPTPTEGVVLAGTLTRPAGPGPHPGVVLISGSGPQDRDETLFEHRPFAVLADSLTRAGYAVLRYDDRGVGRSTGNFPAGSTLDFAVDAETAFEWLKARPEVGKAGFVGHSEGGMVAFLIGARRTDVAFLILLAAPGQSGSALLSAQQEEFGRMAGYSDEFLAKSRTLEGELLQAASANLPVDERKARLRAVNARSVALMGPEDRRVHEKFAHLDEASVNQLASPWYAFFLAYDPAGDLRKVKCPVLALNGTLDMQVRAGANLPLIKNALESGGNKSVEIRSLPGLNHLFQHAVTGNPNEYAKIQETLAPEALNFIRDWLQQTCPAGRTDGEKR